MHGSAVAFANFSKEVAQYLVDVHGCACVVTFNYVIQPREHYFANRCISF